MDYCFWDKRIGKNSLTTSLKIYMIIGEVIKKEEGNHVSRYFF